ncbi:MAG: YidC/Oxa1 family membrane protein insertase [Patescibacteria group bacterium]
MSGIFNLILLQPIFNIFVFIYNLVPNVALVILIITILIKVILYPFNNKSIKAQKELSELQPKLEELKTKYKGDQQKIATETMKIYSENKINPFSSCLPLLIQLPVFIALYWVLRSVLDPNQDFAMLYSFIKNPENINPIAFGFNLTEIGSWTNLVLAVLAGAAQYFQTKMFTKKKAPKVAGEASKDEDMASMMNKQMLYMMPIMTILIGYKLPAGLTLYWFLSTILTWLQQMVLFKKKDENKNEIDKDVVEGKLVK